RRARDRPVGVTGAPAEIRELAERRARARAERDFALADRLRDDIATAGWVVRDEAGGYTLEPKPAYDVIGDVAALTPRRQRHRAAARRVGRPGRRGRRVARRRRRQRLDRLSRRRTGPRRGAARLPVRRPSRRGTGGGRRRRFAVAERAVLPQRRSRLLVL